MVHIHHIQFKLLGIRKARRLTQVVVAEYINGRFPGRAVNTLVLDITGYERYGSVLTQALSGREPYCTTFKLYLEAISQEDEGRKLMSDLFRFQNFDPKVDESVIARGRDFYAKTGKMERKKATADRLVYLNDIVADIPDVGYDIQKVELHGDELRIYFEEEGISLEDAVYDFKYVLRQQGLPRSIGLDYRHSDDHLVITLRTGLSEFQEQSSRNFLEAYRSTLEKKINA